MCNGGPSDTLAGRPARVTIDQTSSYSSIIADLSQRDGGYTGVIWEFHAFNAGPGLLGGTLADPIAGFHGSRSSWGERDSGFTPLWEERTSSNEWTVAISVDETFHLTGAVDWGPWYGNGVCQRWHLDLMRQ